MDRVGTCMKTGRISSIQKSRFNPEIIVSLKLLRETDLIKFSYSRSDFIPKSTLILSLLRRFIISSVSKNLHCLQYHPIASNPRFSWLWRRKILDSNLRLRIYSLKLFSSDLQYLQDEISSNMVSFRIFIVLMRLWILWYTRASADGGRISLSSEEEPLLLL